MDGRMIKAAPTGNVDELERLMREDTLVRDSVALLGAQTPLHIASLCGHVSFFRTTNIETEEAICGRDGTLPLHCASLKGRIHVMTALLSAAPLTIRAKTSRGETPLHIAVKNYQFDAVKFLMKYAKTLKMERGVLNDKDNQANTVLHLVASMKQYQILDIVLGEDDVAMVVNSVNERGMTPLDLTLEVGDLNIYKCLVKAGAKSGKDIENENEISVPIRNC
ncbi:ankyrin repeat-containing protein At2g01680 [Vigna radiata var. radiata]|uniref:Ankyrin repeat-containing protein At2g01680 n=1 Tax=Vigna radiata var. radiata TaxID=3916 RepID=A0A1S3TYY4_VIGRR|nr:ankyrin repeat-containing protein At2g01680 [Vigna radiata var. radiata]